MPRLAVSNLECIKPTSGDGADDVYVLTAVQVDGNPLESLFVNTTSDGKWKIMTANKSQDKIVLVEPKLQINILKRAAFALVERDYGLDFSFGSTEHKKLELYLRLISNADALFGNESAFKLSTDLAYGLGRFRSNDDIIGVQPIPLDKLVNVGSQWTSGKLTGDGGKYNITFTLVP